MIKSTFIIPIQNRIWDRCICVSAELLQIGVVFVITNRSETGFIANQGNFYHKKLGQIYYKLEQVLQIEAIIKISLLQIEVCNVMRDISRLKVIFCVTRAYKKALNIGLL